MLCFVYKFWKRITMWNTNFSSLTLNSILLSDLFSVSCRGLYVNGIPSLSICFYFKLSKKKNLKRRGKTWTERERVYRGQNLMHTSTPSQHRWAWTTFYKKFNDHVSYSTNLHVCLIGHAFSCNLDFRVSRCKVRI